MGYENVLFNLVLFQRRQFSSSEKLKLKVLQVLHAMT